jgi:signal transduction histidine kinase
MLDADKATQQGDREHEIIDDKLILGDEIGQTMRSRNATILELRRHEEVLEEALRKLEAQDRLVSLGLLSASVAHELNTPLSVLQGSIEKLIETASDKATLERLQRTLRVTQRLRKISEGLVDFARVRKQIMEPVKLRPLIDEAWNLWLAQLRQTLRNAVEKFGFGRAAQDRLRESLGHRIKMLRVERDWSLKDLAATTKFSVSQISSIERGANLPSIESLLLICWAFDKRPSDVLASIEF